jgi:hypothetical protein
MLKLSISERKKKTLKYFKCRHGQSTVYTVYPNVKYRFGSYFMVRNSYINARARH